MGRRLEEIKYIDHLELIVGVCVLLSSQKLQSFLLCKAFKLKYVLQLDFHPRTLAQFVPDLTENAPKAG